MVFDSVIAGIMNFLKLLVFEVIPRPQDVGLQPPAVLSGWQKLFNFIFELLFDFETELLIKKFEEITK
jgi:hypothetical protein